MVALDPMLAVVEVSERQLAGLKVGDAAEVRLVTGQKAMGRVRFVSKSASAADPHLSRRGRDQERRRRHSGRHHCGSRSSAGAGAVNARAALGADLLVRQAISACASSTTTARSISCRCRVVEDEQRLHVGRGMPDGARVIVQGQDFVREGQRVEPCRSAKPRRTTADDKPHGTASMFKLIDYAISHARLTIATLIFLLAAGLRGLS